MSKLFRFYTKDHPGSIAYDVVVRLDKVAEAYIYSVQDYDVVTKVEERQRSFWSRLFSDWSRRTEVVEEEDRLWYKMFHVGVSDRLTTNRDRHITLAKTKSEKQADEMLAVLQAALEAQ